MKTREYNEQHIRNGGSVLWKGRLIEKIEDLPSDTEMAEADASRAVEVGAAKTAGAAADAAHAKELADLAAENERLKAELEAAKAGTAGPDGEPLGDPGLGTHDVEPAKKK